jgi:membrane protease YdiL (CAAX protease family)
MPRSTALGRALLFLIATIPLWALKQGPALFNPVGLVALALAVTMLFLWWDKRSPAVLGLDPKLRRLGELALGFVAGALLVVVIAVVMYFALPYPWQRNPGFQPVLAAWSVLTLLAATGVEELVFRGYSFERMISAIGHWPAQIVTALLFALYHVLHGWSWPNALVGTTLGSILFGLVFVRWRSVPAAVGVHAAGTWTRDLLLADPATMRTYIAPFSVRRWMPLEEFTARVVWNGGVFVACIVMAIVVYRFQKREGARVGGRLATAGRA